MIPRQLRPSQFLNCVQFVGAQLNPELLAGSRPKVARQATRQLLTAIVDIDEFLLAVNAPIHAALVTSFGRQIMFAEVQKETPGEQRWPR
jgi:hypothetical protein